jgi:hypothetical protein
LALVTPLTRTPELEAVVARARRSAQEAGELDLPTGPFESPWVPELRDAVATILNDGTFAEAARSVALSDPDLA